MVFSHVAIGTDTIQLSPRGHTAFMLDQRYPFTAAKRGSIQFDTSLAAQISVLGLRFIGTALTTIPSLALAIPASSLRRGLCGLKGSRGIVLLPCS